MEAKTKTRKVPGWYLGEPYHAEIFKRLFEMGVIQFKDDKYILNKHFNWTDPTKYHDVDKYYPD